MLCSKCGAPLAETDTFCGACGNPVDPMPGGATAAAQPGYLPTAPPVSTASGAGGYYQGLYLDPVTNRPLSSWGRRVGAYLIDGVILWIVGFILNAIFGPAFTTTTGICNTSTGYATCTQLHVNGGKFAAVIILDLAVAIAYWVVLIGGRRGQTVGMMALSIAVRDSRGDTPIGPGRAFVRMIVLTALSLPFGIPWLIDVLSPLWDKRRQAWHDHAANSVVVDQRFPAR